MNGYTLRGYYVLAWRLDPHNLVNMAELVNGSVKGIKLPIEERCIDFYDAFTSEEIRVNMGDWIVKWYTGNAENGNCFTVFTDKQFQNIFTLMGEK